MLSSIPNGCALHTVGEFDEMTAFHLDMVVK